MSEILSTLASYTSPLVVRHLSLTAEPITALTVERFQAAVLFADITGFTALAEQLTRRGPAGAEQISGMLNGYFGQLTAHIMAYGGDVIKFAGDALLAIWPQTDEDLPTKVLRAAQCGLAMQRMLEDYRTVEGVRALAMRLGIGAGEVLAAHLGGAYGRWEFGVVGSPLIQANVAEQQSQPGEVILAPEAWALVQGACDGTPIGSEAIPSIHLRSVEPFLSFHPAFPPELRPEMETTLRAYIPGAVLSSLAAGQVGWLAELRQLTILFLNLSGLNDAARLEAIQLAINAAQTALYRYEGSINNLNASAQGITLVAALGLPPLAHEDDAVRGVQAALAMQAELRRLGLSAAIGITSGRAFCGAIGSELRREYTMIGDVVNLAARLMQAALPGDILCDASTYQAAQAYQAFEMLPPITVKGKSDPIAVFRPATDVPIPPARIQNYKQSATQTAHLEMIGRAAERTLLAEQIQSLLRGGPGGVVVIEGESGIGKSRLVLDLLDQAQHYGVPALVGAGDAIELSTSFHAWRSVFSRLLGLESVDDPDLRRAQVMKFMEPQPELRRLAPLLNAILPLDFLESEATAQVVSQIRADNTRDLLMRLLQIATSARPRVLVLEDVQWLDSASWALLLAVQQHVRPLLIVLTARAPDESMAAEYQQVVQPPEVKRVSLGELSVDDTATFVEQCLNVTAVPKPVIALIHEKAGGHPFFSEELAYALRDAGLIEVTEGVCRIAPGAGDLRTIDLPATVQGVITSRIDRVSPPEQMVLKVASVIGYEFAFRTLHAVYPVPADQDRLADYLTRLQKLDIVVLKTARPEAVYRFKHAITQEVAYNRMLFGQRRRLHRAIAEWYESAYANDLTAYYPRLAYHWGKADVKPKAIEYLELAGEQALPAGAYQEAIDFFSEALRLTEDTPGAGDPFQRARWERRLGKAHYSLGHSREGREHLARALALLNRPVPATRGRLIIGLVQQVAHQAARLVLRRPVKDQAATAPLDLTETTRAYELLTVINYYELQKIPGTYTALRNLNLAESLGASPELARSYATMCLAAGIVPLHRFAAAYSRRAHAVVQHIDDPSSQLTVLLITAMYSAGIGQWAQARGWLDQGREIADRLNDRRRWKECVANLANTLYYQGEFEQSLQAFAELQRAAQRDGDYQALGWSLSGQGQNAVRLGQIDQALAWLKARKAMLDSTPNSLDFEIFSYLAAAYLRHGQLDLAGQAATMSAQLIGRVTVTSYYSLAACVSTAETCLTLWETSSAPDSTPYGDRSALKDLARQACQALHRAAHVFPIGQPAAWLWQGAYDWLVGKPAQARRHWQKSLNLAESRAMPYEQALAHYEIARHLAVDDQARRLHLDRAYALFDRLQADYDRKRVQALLT